MRWKNILTVCMSFAMIFTGCELPQKNTASSVSNPRVGDGVTTWDKVRFGRYYQEAEFSAQPIKWRVLSVDKDNNALLLADKILDAKPYNENAENKMKDKDVTWKECTLRKWLNEDFYNAAFDEEEKKAVIETTVVNEDNPAYDTEGGDNTKDKVYLLSIAEANDPAYGFDTEKLEEGYAIESDTRKSENTDYTKYNVSTDGNYGCWWLRTPGYDGFYAPIVYEHGGIGDDGDWTNSSIYGIRPALQINLSSTKVTYAGEVDSGGSITENGDTIDNPVVKDGITTWSCVYFGHYRQEFAKQDIEWRVLSVDGDDVFLLADKNLDAQPYNEEKSDITWEECTLRKWLNDDFYHAAFNDEEQDIIMETTVVNEDNPYYGTEGGGNSTDKVYLLSIDEAANEEYGFHAEFSEEDDTRKAYNTDYVKLNYTRDDTGCGYWILRSPGEKSNNVSYVNGSGGGVGTGYNTDYGKDGIRPVIHIKLSSTLWEKAGVVSSNMHDLKD